TSADESNPAQAIGAECELRRVLEPEHPDREEFRPSYCVPGLNTALYHLGEPPSAGIENGRTRIPEGSASNCEPILSRVRVDETDQVASIRPEHPGVRRGDEVPVGTEGEPPRDQGVAPRVVHVPEADGFSKGRCDDPRIGPEPGIASPAEYRQQTAGGCLPEANDTITSDSEHPATIRAELESS